MTQFARPTSDVSNAGAWINQASSSSNLWQSIDETPAVDTDYVRNPASALNETYVAGLNSIIDPVSSSGHVIRVRALRNVPGDATAVTVRLRQGATQIASFTPAIVDAATDFSYTLSTGEADAITDYTNLRLDFIETAGFSARITQASFETPDVGGTSNQQVMVL